MKRTILSLFLASCASGQVFEKQLETYRKELEALQQDRDEQREVLKKIVLKLKNKTCTIPSTPVIQEKHEIKKVVCVIDEIENTEICMDIVSEESK